jgi:hypothetical protein
VAKTITRYRYKYNKLIKSGLLSWEAREIADKYTMTQIKQLPYAQNVMKARRLYIGNMRKRGYKDTEIRDRIFALYDTKDWLTNDGRPDVWMMIRTYRKKSITDGDYVPPKRKGSHHKIKGISKGDLQSQRSRRKSRVKDKEREDLRQDIIRATAEGNQKLRHELEQKYFKKYEY